MKITVKSPRASATCMTAIGLALAAAATSAASPAQAATRIATDTTAALLTSGAGDITITEDGSITVDAGDAITVDSDATVDNDGAIEVGDADGAAGIRVKAGTTATIVNSGTITVSEDYVPADDDANSIPDGAIAAASGRYGIVVEGGSQGSIENSGTITVEGLNSAGIALLGDYTGSITQVSGGATYVYGDYSTGLLTGNVDGDITIEGVISATGEGARAMAVEGDVTGSIVIQGTVRQNVTYTTDDSDVLTLSRKDVRVGAAAVEITGNVAGGISVAGPPLDLSSTSTDEDGDGVTDSEEATGTVTSYGNGPALLIGGASDTTIGAVTGNDGTYSLNIEGTVIGTAYYSSTDAYGAVIGGQGGNVTLTDGIGVSGALRATTYDAAATALLINPDSQVSSLYVCGAIIAQITSTGEGSAYAVHDLSGTLTSIVNTGTISASGSSEDLLRAIDVSANTTGVTITQYLNAVDIAARAEIEEDGDEDTTVYAHIYGDVVTGSGDDTFAVSTGSVTGSTYFNAGEDSLLLSGDATYTGKVHSGAGTLTVALAGEAAFTGTIDADGQIALLTIADSAVYKGNFADAANVTVDVTGGSLRAKAAETVSFGTLNVGAGGTIGVYIDSENGTNSLFDVTSATFADGARVTAEITQLAGAEGSYTFLTTDTLTGLPSFDTEATDLPYIFDAGVTQSGGDLVLTITRKTATALGLTASNSAAWDAIFVAADADEDISASLLAITDSDTLNTQVSELLPDHSGSVFDLVTRGSRLAARHVMDDSSFFKDYDTGMWMEPIMWRTSKETGDTASYSGRGWGISTGYEERTGIGMVGLSYTYTHGKISDNDGAGELSISQNEVAAFWRTSDGPLYGFARVSGAHLGVDSTRTFTGTIDDTDFSYASTGKWNGWLVGAMGGASMNFDVTEDVSLKPMVVADYFRLWEKGYTESGGGDAMDLTVLDRTSSVAGATASLTASYRFGPRTNDARPLTVEVEGGYRNVLSSKLGTTSAYFTDGATFSIAPEKLKGGFQGEARLLAGGWDYTWQLAARADQNTDGSVDYSGRASLSIAF